VIISDAANSRAIALPKPVYPAVAVAVRASGLVRVQVTVDEKGNVIEAVAIKGHLLLRAAAVAAARRAKYDPARVGGVPVRMMGTIDYHFGADAKPADEEPPPGPEDPAGSDPHP
jgi:TonB family protein